MGKVTAADAALDRNAVREVIYGNAVLSRGYLLMNVLAATIASYGLLANSPSVVIGAMIVAMLLGPIMGTSLSLLDSNLGYLRKSLAALGAGVVVVICTALLIGLVHRDIPITGEIMARTAPNLMDLMVALASGAVGAYATVSPRLSVVEIIANPASITGDYLAGRRHIAIGPQGLKVKTRIVISGPGHHDIALLHQSLALLPDHLSHPARHLSHIDTGTHLE